MTQNEYRTKSQSLLPPSHLQATYKLLIRYLPATLRLTTFAQGMLSNHLERYLLIVIIDPGRPRDDIASSVLHEITARD